VLFVACRCNFHWFLILIQRYANLLRIREKKSSWSHCSGSEGERGDQVLVLPSLWHTVFPQRVEEWCSSWHRRSCTWRHTRWQGIRVVRWRLAFLHINGCALAAAISQSSCHPLFCSVSGRYFPFSSSVYCVKLAKETFSSLIDDDVNRKYWMCILDLKMDPAWWGILGFCGRISPPTVARSCLCRHRLHHWNCPVVSYSMKLQYIIFFQSVFGGNKLQLWVVCWMQGSFCDTTLLVLAPKGRINGAASWA
jgi:hypothetical protein